MSIIRDAFAEEMGLESKPITILIAKVGETEEEINTKLYKVPILATNGRATQTIEAVGMPQVSHDTTTINIDQVSEMFGPSKSEVHRKPGPIDILVGINYPNFHTGETKVKDGLVARKSPLGCVIFGPNSQSSSSEAKQICPTSGYQRILKNRINGSISFSMHMRSCKDVNTRTS